MERTHGDEKGMCILDETLKCDNCGEDHSNTADCPHIDSDNDGVCDLCKIFMLVDPIKPGISY